MCYSVMVEQDLKKLSLSWDAELDLPAFAQWQAKTQAGIKPWKTLAEHPRIYPNYGAPVLVAKGEQRCIKPMRYRLRPQGSLEEIPSKFNVFNAREDSLETRKTWSALLYRQHGVLQAKGFFEWVQRDTRKQVVYFSPVSYDSMLIPVLWDYWQDAKQEDGFYSFALITRDPPPEVLAGGHDRCPIFLKRAHLEAWLHPEGRSRQEIKAILHDIEPARYQWQDAKP